MNKENFYYSSERNVQIVLALLKANRIRKIIASPGATNITFVGSVQNDPYFEVYSAAEERSAAYMACGMAAESGEPVALSCTGATASRNYYPGLTEAFYRKLPVLAITSHQGSDRIGQLLPQNINRHNLPEDIARISVELPIVKDQRDEDYVTMLVNKAILELRRNGGCPVHINIITSNNRDFSVKELPPVRVMRRIQAWDEFPEMSNGKIAVYVGSHVTFTPKQTVAIDCFCATYDAVVICDHTSGYYGRYRLLPTLVQFQSNATSPFPLFDLMIHIGEVSAATFAGTIPTKEIWRVSEDGELRDPFKKLTTVFQMSEEFFFLHYGKDGSNKHSFIDNCRQEFGAIYSLIPELPFSNVWVSMQLSQRLPKNSLLHIGVSHTRRCWNMFPLPEGVESACNVGCCGIDGCISSLIGASLANPERPCYCAVGDLTFFYDMNSLGNRHVGRNVRILLINNGRGTEFRNYGHPAARFGEEADRFIAAAGHYGNKSHALVRHYAEDLGFEYMHADTKEEFLSSLDRFTASQLTEKPMLLEVFTDSQDESDALKIMSTLATDTKGMMKSTAKKVLPDSVKKMLKGMMNK